MKWNIGSTSASSSSWGDASGLPSNHPNIAGLARTGAPPAGCPMHDSPPALTPASPSPAVAASSSSSSIPKASPRAAECPIPHDQRALHPLNRIPMGLSSTERSPGQVLDLPTDREVSSIPRPHRLEEASSENEEDLHSGKWEYPSPQQFYNALVRKGWETPEDSIEMVVAIHNFLNERAWDEVMRWEKRLPGGEHAQLARFEGKPGELSPKARMHLWAGKIFPSRFNTEPPFDRHDWIVTRPEATEAAASASSGVAQPARTSTFADQNPTYSTNAEPPTTPASSTTAATSRTSTTRYVIDYYDAGKDEDGNPVFSLDVRPALDSFQSISERIKVGVEELMRGQNEQ